MKTVERAMSFLKFSKDDKLLETACGCAEFSIAASQYVHSVDCIDLDDFRLKPEINSFANIHFQKMDAACMTYENNIFDKIVIYNAAMHLEQVMDQVLKECLRVMKEAGELFIISSYSMDKPVIKDIALLLDGWGISYKLVDVTKFMVLKIRKSGEEIDKRKMLKENS